MSWRIIADLIAINATSLSSSPPGMMPALEEAEPEAKGSGAFHGPNCGSRLRNLRSCDGAGRRAGADNSPPAGDSIDGGVRLLLGRGEARPASRVRRHHRRRHAADQHAECPSAGGRAAGEDPGL